MTDKRMIPEEGVGKLPPLCAAESLFTALTDKLVILASILLFINVFLITIDVAGRQFFSMPLHGYSDFEQLGMCMVGFLGMTLPALFRQSMQIDLLYNNFSGRAKRFFFLMGSLISMLSSGYVAYAAMLHSFGYASNTPIFGVPEGPLVFITGFCLALTAVAFLFHVIRGVQRIVEEREFLSLILVAAVIAFFIALPFMLKAYKIKPAPLTVGGIGFAVLLCIILMRIPLGFAMSAVGIIGLLVIMKRPSSVVGLVSTIPYNNLTSAIMMAFPVFMLMGEMVSLAGLSDDLFDAAQKWLGRLPGGLAIAAIGGCAGFGAVCGESLATVLTMSAVALPAMEKNGYNIELCAGSLAAGGTLGILIPPSMGFIVYSMITDVSVGKLFISGILPGILLCSIFMLIVAVRCVLKPSLAPKAPSYPLSEKIKSILWLVPVAILFTVVVLGILRGWFTPAEGGAVGSFMAMFYAAIRGKLSWKSLKTTLRKSTLTFGKMFSLFVGLYVLNAFLTSSRLPNLLADAVAALEINKYLILAAVILLYVVLGCVMNIMPIMTLTLPSIYPTVEMLGFDMVWFGTLCVVVMEMGQITPPVGLNVFTLAGLRSDIPMATIYKGVMPFFLGMLLCIAIIIVFPQIALYLVN